MPREVENLSLIQKLAHNMERAIMEAVQQASDLLYEQAVLDNHDTVFQEALDLVVSVLNHEHAQWQESKRLADGECCQELGAQAT